MPFPPRDPNAPRKPRRPKPKVPMVQLTAMLAENGRRNCERLLLSRRGRKWQEWRQTHAAACRTEMKLAAKTRDWAIAWLTAVGAELPDLTPPAPPEGAPNGD